MKKILLTFGDSFTYGDELTDRNSAWPIQLADAMGYQAVNLGKPGNSNDSIVSQLVEYVANPDLPNPDLVVIGWTSPARVQFADEFGEYIVWPGRSSVLFTNELLYRSELIEYISKYHNSEYIFKTYINQVVLAQTFLTAHNIRYVMCDILGKDYYASLHKHKFNHYYDTVIDTSVIAGWPSDGMAEWAYGCKKGSRGHFLEDGHKKVSNKIYEHIRNLGWLS